MKDSLTQSEPRPHESAAAIDWNDLYDRIPDEALIIQFAASFKENTPALLGHLAQAVEQNNPQQIEAQAHALKGASANLGAIRLAKAAWQLEHAAHEQQPDCCTLMRAVAAEYAAVMELLALPDWTERIKTRQS